MNLRRDNFWESELSKTIFQSINVWVNVCDADLNILVWNPTAERISGYIEADVVGHPHVWDWLYPDADYKQWIQDLASELLVHDTALSHITTEIICRNHEKKNIAWYSRPLLGESGEAQGFVTFGYDVTEQKRSEDALHKANNELQVLYQIASITSEYTNINQIFEHSLEQILSITDASGGIVFIWNPEQNKLEIATQIGAMNDRIDTGQFFDQIYEKDTMDEVRLPDQSRFLSIPMFAKGQFQGVIGILLQPDQLIPDDQRHLLRSIADQIGIAIDNAHLYQRSKKLAVAEERRRLARDLHDSVTQSLYSLTLFAEAGQRTLQEQQFDRVEQYLERLTMTAQDALKEMRLLLFELRPWDLESGRLIEMIQQRLDVVERRSGITAHLVAGTLPPLSRKLEENIYYIVIEALNNALKHAHSDAISVSLAVHDDCIKLSIADNGIGFDMNPLDKQGGLGLQNISERVAELNGQLKLTSNMDSGKGTIVEAMLPVNGQNPHD